MEFPNFEKIDRLKQLIDDTYRPLIDGDYVMLDFPNYRNIGDNLIWKGEEEFMKTIPHKCLYAANINAFQKHKVPKGAIILLQGGGNFGDIYNNLQSFRLKIIQSFPDHKIIIFPQTIHYENDAEFIRQAEILKAHKNLYITARDSVSKSNLESVGINERVLFAPDMAFWIDFSEFFSNKKTGKSLYMKRVDSELNNNYIDGAIINILEHHHPGNNIEILDWPSYTSNKAINKFVSVLDGLETKASRVLSKIPIVEKIIDSKYGLNPKSNMSNYILTGIEFINSYDLICTTRLHGFILSVLLNKNVRIIDNSYGKNSNFYNTWMKDFDNVELVKK
ncbi:polysaccharide pyruvyl transferase family protein [Flavobacteriaceae bacterium]|nr:polysaccharide pyruvyl transferase family protein [Flavobacteriaceae bacterium]